MAKTNRVKEAREAEAISRAELARRSGVVDKTIKNIEEGITNCMQHTKTKIIKGFNSLENKQRDYTIEYLFNE
jgi:DNA-binding XRE family transcriptional regulator